MENKPPKFKPTKAQRYLRNIKLDLLYRKFGTILTREADALLVESWGGPLEKSRAEALVRYLRLVKEMKKLEVEDAKGMSEEELERLASE